jgi:type II secretion system protein C
MLPPEEEPGFGELQQKKIYEHDLFDTYTPPREEGPSPITIPPLPSPKPTDRQQPTPPKKPELLPPLTITLKGIMYSSDQIESIALIADETGKEQSYALGEKIKDAQLIKIAQQSIVLLRSNGQQETIALRKDEQWIGDKDEKWDAIVKKEDDTSYVINIDSFTRKIPTVGDLLQQLSLATSYQKQKPIGVRIGAKQETDVVTVLGLKTGDVVTAINGIGVGLAEERIEAFATLEQAKKGDTINILLLRDKEEMQLSYTLTRASAIGKPPFGKAYGAEDDAIKAGLFKLSREQQRAQQQRKFNQRHERKDRQKTVEEMRKSLLKNMKQRQLNMRAR